MKKVLILLLCLPAVLSAQQKYFIGVNVAPSTDPFISIIPSSLSSFNTPSGTPSAPDSSFVSGGNLTANITITMSSNIEGSFSRTTGYSTTTLTLTQSGGIVASTKVYFRVRSTAAPQSLSEQEDLTSSGAVSKHITCTGTVTGGSATVVAQFNFALSSAAGGVSGWVDCLGTPLSSVCTASDSRSGSAIGVSTVSTSNWANVVSSTTSSNGWGATVGNPTFFFPSGVYPGGFGTVGTAYTPGQEQIQFSGLNPAKHYLIEIMGSRITGQTTRRCVYFIVDNVGTTSDTLDVKDNTASHADFTGQVPTSGGIIKMAMKRDASDTNNTWGAYLMATRITQLD